MKIVIRHNSDYLSPYWDSETDREASVSAYNEGLTAYLSQLYGAEVEVIDIPDLQRDEIDLEPCPDDPRDLLAQIQRDCEEYWARGEFWVLKGEATV